jgi:DNA processing protein
MEENRAKSRGISGMSFAERYEAGVVEKPELAKVAWMALMLTPGMGPTRIWKAMGRLGAAERLFEASLTELEGLGMPPEAAQFCFEGKARAAAEDEMKRVVEAGGSVLTPED